ncbi:hypothetical protein [Roseicitreum antarcticum]|uniref:Uncharacterized protein n=1 Tax=Roseicitreum antarcticum TaxID=564137 RepID=A0A1H2RCG2_9RHOB|nr:hypothetical protein [Roseicitreum antarcticum]SDW17107.1 hypothetical protein SAMN04488238_101266 [Roseicitreum antarcticum]
MSDRIRADFQARRARILKKHAARNPEWQRLRRERRASGLSIALSLLIALAIIGVGFKGLTLARLGPEGFAQATASIATSPAGPSLPAWLLGPDPVSDALARLFRNTTQAQSTTVAALTD